MATRVRTPTVLQMEAVECAAAALGIILAYYGRWETLEQLRSACGISRDGSKASNILKAARGYGLEAHGFKMELAQVRLQKPPFIVFWGFNHFLVVEGFGPDVVYLNDPGTGPRTVTDQEFSRSFTGVTLTFAPGPEFQKAGSPPDVTRALAARLQGSYSGLLYVVLASLALVLPGLALPAFVQVFVDRILVGGAASWLPALLTGLAAGAALQAGLTWLQQEYLLRLESRLAVTSSSRFFWHVLRLPMDFYAERFAGEVGNRVALNDRLAQLLSGQLATAFFNLTTLVFYAGLMFVYDWRLTLVALSMAVLNFVALSYVSRVRVDGSRRLQQEQGRLVGTSMGGLQIMESLKASGYESDFFARWAGLQARVITGQQELGLSTGLLSLVPPFLATLNTAAILGLGSLRVIDGDLSLGALVAFQVLAAGFMQPINELVGLGSQIQEAHADLGRLDDVLDNPVDPALTTPKTGETRRLQGALELRDVTFGYNRLEKPLIQGLDLTVKPGQRVALVGTTGSGKSTVARLVTGLAEPWSGQVLLDGKPRADLPREVVASSLAHVDQNIMLFEGTVRDNLTLWDPTVGEERMIRAARDAAIHEAVMARRDGYGSHVVEGGANFSGGERQRLEIARALAGEPALLVLDEATSALDALVEKAIDDNLRARGCSCLLIAHRLSTIRDCDEILVLHEGQVVQRGTHAQMLQAGGPYADLVASELGEEARAGV